jgi:hypothetical protein
MVEGIIGPLSSREPEVLSCYTGLFLVRDRSAGGTPTLEKGRSVT